MPSALHAILAAMACTAAGASAATTGTPACEPAALGGTVRTIEGQHHVLAWRTDPEPIRIGEFFIVDIAVCARGKATAPTSLRIDAQMPEHRHGMNYRPGVARKSDGRFVAHGLLLHMPGRWELRFNVQAAEKSETLSASLILR